MEIDHREVAGIEQKDRANQREHTTNRLLILVLAGLAAYAMNLLDGCHILENYKLRDENQAYKSAFEWRLEN